MTKEPIRIQQEKTQMEAYKKVFPDAKSFEDLEGFSPEAASKVISENTTNTVDDHAGDEINAVVVAKDQITALDSYNERVTALMRRTVELVKSSSSCIEEINGRIGDEDDSQYSSGEKTLHR